MTEKAETDRRRRGFWLRTARERRGWTQSDVAQRLGYSGRSASTVKKWEAGERDVPARHLAVLARIYGIPARVLLNPEQTAQERLDDLARAAGEFEREDWEQDTRDDSDGADGPADRPHTLPR